MAEIVALGTNAGYPNATLGQFSLVLLTETKKLLIDAGEPCSRALFAAGIEPGALDGIFLTHGHADHTGGLPLLLQTLFIAGRTSALRVYLPAELMRPLQDWLDACYVGPRFLPFPLEFVDWESGPDCSFLGVTTQAVPTSHLDAFRRRYGGPGYHAFSLKIRWGAKSLVVSGDLGAPEDLAEQLREPADTLVCELAHFAPDALFRFLRDKQIARLILIHLAERLQGEVKSLLAQAVDALPGVAVHVAQDGERWTI